MTLSDWHACLADLDLAPAQPAQALPGALPDPGFCDLGDLTLLEVAGAEAEAFLQGQLTCDVRELAEGMVRPAAHLTPKGRAVATFLAWREQDRFRLQFPSVLEETVTRRLRMFLLRTKATIAPADADLVRLGAWGAQAAAVATELAGALPDGPFRHVQRGAVTVLALPGTPQRYELLLPASEAARAARRLAAAGAVACGPAAWRLLDIRAGLGWVRPETGEAFLPQMLNYDLLGGIGFRKGCYVGQEVVARLHHLGQVKRRAANGRCEVAAPPPPGTALISPSGGGRQGAGTVVDAVMCGTGPCELLAVVERQALAAGGLRLDSADGPEVTLGASPFPDADAASPAGRA